MISTEAGFRVRSSRDDHRRSPSAAPAQVCEAKMGKQRSSLRQVPWQSWEHWNWVATELFSDSTERISCALDRVAAWQSRGNTPIAVETSAAIIGIHQRDPQVKSVELFLIDDSPSCVSAWRSIGNMLSRGISQGLALPEEMLRMMYSMAIQRLVNGVVDQSQKRNTTSVADRAGLAGLPRLLVDVRHEAAHTELPGLALLRVASKQALGWLKSQYWDQQRKTLINARLELKAKLVEHCLLVVDILNPRCSAPDPQQPEDEQEPDKKSEKLLEVDPQETLRVKKHQRIGLLNDVLDLSLSSMPNLVSILVEDGLLEKDTLGTEGEAFSKQEIVTGPTDCDNLISVTDSAWKFTLRELCSHLPRLSEMLIVAIINHLNNSSLRSVTMHLPENAGPSISQASDFNIGEMTDFSSLSKERNRLISWCAWLLGKRYVQDIERPSEQEPQKLKLLKISNSLFVKTDLTIELLKELLRLCLSTSDGREPLTELVSSIAGRLGNGRFQHRVVSLAHLGTSLQGAQQDIIYKSEDQQRSVILTAGDERPREGSSEKASAASPADGDCSSGGSETIGSAIEVARSQQSSFFARFSSERDDATTNDTLIHKEPGVDGLVKLKLPNKASSLSTLSESNQLNSLVPTNVGRRKEWSAVQRWTVVENWRPCAIGMIPVPGHSVGVLPSLDLHRHVDEAEKVPCRPGSVSSEETATDTARKLADDNNLGVAGSREDPAAGKRTTDEHLEESMKRKKLKKTDRHVNFVDEDVANVSVRRCPTFSNQAVRNEKEQWQTGSLLQGCLLQQGMYLPLTSQQLESLKSSIHVL